MLYFKSGFLRFRAVLVSPSAYASASRRWHSVKCWSCGHEEPKNSIEKSSNSSNSSSSVKNLLFCSNEDCGKIQPLEKEMDYFDLLGFPEGKKKFLSSEMSPDSLEKAYKGLQKCLHPDLFCQKSLVEQEMSATNSALVNAAYQCLRHDVDRAGYILSKYYGLDVLSETGGSHSDPELNMTIFEMREEIEDMDYSDKATVEDMLTSLKASMELIKEALNTAIIKGDADLMTREAVKLRYWVKMVEEVEDRSEGAS